jgi:hypothetical protein
MNCWPIYVKREHIALLQVIWIERMPQFYSWFTVDDAWRTWAMFKENPADPKLAKLKMAVNELWLMHVQAN